MALRRHDAGELRAAEQMYRQVLQVEPNQPDALHLLGVLAHQVGKHDVAVEYIGRAIAVKGDAASFHYNLARAQEALRRSPEAIAAYERAVALKPDFAEAYSNLGNILEAVGKRDDAVGCSY